MAKDAKAALSAFDRLLIYNDKNAAPVKSSIPLRKAGPDEDPSLSRQTSAAACMPWNACSDMFTTIPKDE